MAITAHAMPSLDISAADDMDMHSDSGLDFGDGDGDIDLDLEPVPLIQGEDDDVSIVDAASDAGQTGLEEQDDFMADPEDIIEEDDMNSGNEDAILVEKISTDVDAVSQMPILAGQDEDLIDYSDDEGEQTSNLLNESYEDDVSRNHDGEAEIVPNQQEESQAGEVVDGQQVEHSDHLTHDVVDEYDLGVDETNEHEQEPNQSHTEPAHYGDDESVDGDDGGVLLHEINDHVTAETASNERNQTDPETRGLTANDTDDENENHEDKSPTAVQSITVNYAGNELWLFKQHDPDDSGDWLLDDISLMKSRISDVFSNCRTSLGDTVSNEHELGFRFDHLHGLELYEDNTVCVALTLEKLVDLYYTLQAQDSNYEPDSFYISLLSRPRFVTLLSVVVKFAEEGSGYSALNAAVAAGETHFTSVFSESPSEEVTEWDEEQQPGVVTDRQEDSTCVEDQQEVDQVEHASQQYDVSGGEQQPEQYDHTDSITYEPSAEDPLLEAYEDKSILALASKSSADASHMFTKHEDSANLPHDEIHQFTAEVVSEADVRRAQEEEDLVDYSDDEEEAHTTVEAIVPSVRASSPSSFTVQGDRKSATAGENVCSAYSPSKDAQDTNVQKEEEPDDHVEQLGTESNNATTQSFQDYAAQNNHDADKVFDAFQGDEDSAPTFDQRFDYDTHPDLITSEKETSERLSQWNTSNGSELYQEERGLGQNDFTGPEVFLDFDEASAWITDQEPNVNPQEDLTLEYDDVGASENKETGVAGQPSAAVTSDATVVAVSSNKIKTVSPQGQKRSIDEAEHGADDALHLIDTKRPKV